MSEYFLKIIIIEADVMLNQFARMKNNSRHIQKVLKRSRFFFRKIVSAKSENSC